MATQREVRDDQGYFLGFEPRECGEHRTVGDYRAWCYDCQEWCYPKAPCVRCEIVELREAMKILARLCRNSDYLRAVQEADEEAARAAGGELEPAVDVEEFMAEMRQRYGEQK